MRKYNTDPTNRGVWNGLILLLVGVFLLLKNIHLDLPHWVVSWQTLLIGIGFMLGIKERFRGAGWLLLMIVGGIFLLKEAIVWPFDVTRFIWPLVFIVIGLYLIFRRQASMACSSQSYKLPPDAVNSDYIISNNVFGSDNRVMLSKSFKGGKVTCIFAGTDINLTQADFEGTVVLESSIMFGGLELVVPSHWDVKMEVETVFASVEDKRPVGLMGNTGASGKTLILRGKCVFGGIELKSFS